MFSGLYNDFIAMKTTISSDVLSAVITAVRTKSPLVHNITNYVVMNNSANALLAIGASPVMAHWTSEMEEMTAIAGALVINIGTLDDKWIEGMIAASDCNSPSIINDGSISLAKRVASTTLSTISCLADPFVEKLNIAIFGSKPAIARVVRPVQTAI